MVQTTIGPRFRYGGNGDETEGMLDRPPVSPQAGDLWSFLSPLWGGLESLKKNYRPIMIGL